jgi:antitoxin PrlF
MTTSTISSKGQIVIPAAVRSDMQAEAGMRVEFVKVAEGWLLKAAILPVTSLKNMVERPKQRVSVEDMNRSIRSRATKTSR